MDAETPRDYLEAKIHYALAATQVRVEELELGAGQAELVVRIRFEAPIDISKCTPPYATPRPTAVPNAARTTDSVRS